MTPPIQLVDDEDKKKRKREPVKSRKKKADPNAKIKKVVADTKAKREKKIEEARRKEGWFPKRRERTSFSLTSGTSKQGPHFVPHVAKRLMSQRSRKNNPKFDPTKITRRSGLLPSPGQSRKLFTHYQRISKFKIPKKRLIAHDRAYKKQLGLITSAKTPQLRIRATVKAMEMAPMTTYGHGRTPTNEEMQGKGERLTTVAPDLDKMEKMKKNKKAPKLERVDFGGGFPKKHLEKVLRDTGTVSRGEEELSELDTSSEEEYSDEDSPKKKAKKKGKKKY